MIFKLSRQQSSSILGAVIHWTLDDYEHLVYAESVNSRVRSLTDSSIQEGYKAVEETIRIGRDENVLKDYLERYGLRGGIVRYDEKSEELCICMDDYADDIQSDSWKVLSTVIK